VNIYVAMGLIEENGTILPAMIGVYSTLENAVAGTEKDIDSGQSVFRYAAVQIWTLDGIKIDDIVLFRSDHNL
jgi:hypothetical protein